MFVNVVPPLVLTCHCTVGVGIAAGRRRERDRLPAVIVWLVGLVVTTGAPGWSPSAWRRWWWPCPRVGEHRLVLVAVLSQPWW